MLLISSTVLARTNIAISPFRSLIKFGSALGFFGFFVVGFFDFAFADDDLLAPADFDEAVFAVEEVVFFADADFFSASMASRAIFRFLRKLCFANAPLSAPGETL